MIVKMEDKESRELTLLIPCIILGVLLLGSLIIIVVLLLRVKGKYGRCLFWGPWERYKNRKQQA
jgi:hypothetical protein